MCKKKKCLNVCVSVSIRTRTNERTNERTNTLKNKHCKKRNDPSAGSPTDALLRLLFPLDHTVRLNFQEIKIPVL